MHKSEELIFAPVGKTTLVESVMEQVIVLIRQGVLKPGDKLPPERSLMQMMQVGRSTIREAMQGLAALGILEMRSGQGTFVKFIPPLLDQAVSDGEATLLQTTFRLQLLEVREIIEKSVGVWAVHRATEEDVFCLRQQLEGLVRYTRAGDWRKSYERHQAFHRTLAEASHNIVALRVIDSLISTMPPSLMQKFIATSQEFQEEELRVHQAIYFALQARDEGGMRRAIREHMEAERRQLYS